RIARPRVEQDRAVLGEARPRDVHDAGRLVDRHAVAHLGARALALEHDARAVRRMQRRHHSLVNGSISTGPGGGAPPSGAPPSGGASPDAVISPCRLMRTAPPSGSTYAATSAFQRGSGCSIGVARSPRMRPSSTLTTIGRSRSKT